MNKKLLVVVLGLLALTALHRPAHATLTISSEAQFRQYMDLIAKGQLTAKDCLDPDLSRYPNHCYLEVTQSFKLTKPISIPGYVHLVGKVDKDKPVLTFSYDINSYAGTVNRCLMSLEGDSVFLEGIAIDARNYVSVAALASFHDSAICMKGHFGVVNNVTITTPTDSNLFTTVLAITDGITIFGHDNNIANSSITLKFGDGIIVNGPTSAVSKNTVTTFGYGMILNVKDQNYIVSNNVTGKTAFLFGSSAQIPIGQAANVLLFNTLKDTDLNAATTNPQAYAVEYKEKLPLPNCGTCKDITGPEKVGYNDDGSCKKIPANGECMELVGSVQKLLANFNTIEKPSADTTTDPLINQNAPASPGDGSMSGTVPGATPATPTPESREVKMVPTSAMGPGGCSLIRP